MKSYKRRQYLVDKGTFQYKFLLPFVLSWFLATAISTVVFNLLVQKEIEELIWKAHVTVQTTDDIIGKIFFYTTGISVLLVLVFLSLSCLLVRKKSNTLAIRMVNDLNKVAAGDFSQRVRLHKKDAFQDVAAALNGFLEEKATQYRSMRGALAEIQADLGNIRLAEARGALPLQDLERLRGRVALLSQGIAGGETVTAGNTDRA
ncbi:MAG: hypothetical protein K0A99_06555 [Desulfoarculaceae bacterium]|nr:hypothetical protein [Desulfoarculaceae bacterium]